MIDEAVGKILGMAMAYGVSVMGLFLAYVNYRKRIVKAEKVMSPTAWVVVIVSLAFVAGGVLVVGQLANSAPPPDDTLEEVAEAVTARPALQPRTAPDERQRTAWSWIGIVLPAAIFLFATVVTAALHRHFSHPSQAP